MQLHSTANLSNQGFWCAAAFGITLWELYTGRRAFEGVPRALLGHQITRESLRPRFPPGTPQPYKALAECCWQSDWELRCVRVAGRGYGVNPTAIVLCMASQ
jgi:hypothetical protein